MPRSLNRRGASGCKPVRLADQSFFMAPDTILIVEGEEVTLRQFVENNSDEGMLQISSAELLAIMNLKPGEITQIAVHCGFMPIERKGATSAEFTDRTLKFKRKYANAEELEAVLAEATQLQDIANLYYINAELSENHPHIKRAFYAKKQEIQGVKTTAA